MSARPLRVAILGINYAPEPTGIAPYTTGLAEGLAERGHSVRVLTGHPHYPQWQRISRDLSLRSDSEIGGIRVRRLNHFVPAGPSWFGRVAMEVTFGMQLATSRWGEQDVVILVTPPLIAAAMAAVRSRLHFRGRPALGVLVHDLYGKGVVEMHAMSQLPARALCAVESWTLRLADEVAVIHQGFATDLIEQLGVNPERIREIRNWNHVEKPDRCASKAFRERHHWSCDEVVVLHAGNMGHKQGLENVVAAAKIAARDGIAIRFVLLGDGNQRAQLESSAAGVTTLEFMAPVSEADFPAALGAADVLLVNERPGVAQMAVPSKLTSYFRAGRPILAATDPGGYTAGELAASGAGVCVPSDRPELLIAESLRLARDPTEANRLAEAGLRYCDAMLSRGAALDRHEQWIMDLAGNSSRG